MLHSHVTDMAARVTPTIPIPTCLGAFMPGEGLAPIEDGAAVNVGKKPSVDAAEPAASLSAFTPSLEQRRLRLEGLRLQHQSSTA